jgi:hypothetical protein
LSLRSGLICYRFRSIYNFDLFADQNKELSDHMKLLDRPEARNPGLMEKFREITAK